MGRLHNNLFYFFSVDTNKVEKSDKPRPTPKKRGRSSFIESTEVKEVKAMEPTQPATTEESQPEAAKTPKVKTPRIPQIPDPKTYKNIFEESPIVEGKRARKPKVYKDVDEDLDNKPATTPRRQRLKEVEAAKQSTSEANTAEVVPPPVVTKPVNTVSMNPADLEANNPIQFVIGECMWGKVSGHPWWPCIVANDPALKIYTKVPSE